jgi:hypothetical protein
MNDQVKVPNPYLTAIRHVRARSVEPTHGSDHWLDPLEWGDWDRAGRQRLTGFAS